MPHFEDKFVLVTGASSGIGQAVALRFARDGAKIIAVARNPERLENVVANLPGTGHQAISLDASSEVGVDNAAQTWRAAGIQLAAAVLCAGQHALRPLPMLKAAQIDDMLAANVRASLLCTRAAAKLAAKDGCGIVWLASAAALVGSPGEAAYAAAKGGLIAAARALAAELAPRAIRVNVIAPGVVETPMSAAWLGQLTPDQLAAVRHRHLLGFGRPEDIAAAAIFLAGPDARWITGTCLVADGGLTCH